MVCSATLFAWVIILVTVGCLSVQLFELFTDENTQKVQPTYVWVSDLVFIMATLAELLLRVGLVHFRVTVCVCVCVCV